MKIGTRVSIWYAGLLVISLTLLTLVLYFELVYERNIRIRSGVQADSIQEEIVEIVIYYGLPSALLLLGVGWRIVQRSLLPLNRLTAAAEEINANTLHKRLPRSMNHDELDRLAEVFNTMISRIEDSFVRVREFTLHASHELKTPLSILHAGLETMHHNPSTTNEQKVELELRLLEIQRLTRIVENLTFLSKADSGQIPMKHESIRFDELVEEIYLDAQIMARESNIKVSLSKCDRVTISGDKHRLRQLLINIIDNAIKYNQQNGKLIIGLTRDDKTAHLCIENTGPGIKPHNLPRVFNRFFRGDSVLTDQIEGSGLGLSISQWIVQSHRGTISIQSEPQGVTTIGIILPLQGAPTLPKNISKTGVHRA